MPQSKESQRQAMNAFRGMVAMPPIMQNPMMAILAEMNGSSWRVSRPRKRTGWISCIGGSRRSGRLAATDALPINAGDAPDLFTVLSDCLRAVSKAVRESRTHLAETTEAAAKEGARVRH
jgi:hypothetical protein